MELFEQDDAVSPLFTAGCIICRNARMTDVESLSKKGEDVHLGQEMQSDPSLAIPVHVPDTAMVEKKAINSARANPMRSMT